MNERIKELRRQAWDYVASCDEHYSKSATYLFEEKFAELIVCMCADAADMAQDARCKYAGDYVAEYMGYGQEHGVTAWRTK
jgi:hypothetical protein